MAPRLFAAPLRLAPALLIAAASICSSATVAVVPPPIAEAADDAAAPAAAAAAAAPAAADDLAGAASDVAVFAKMELPIPAALPPLKPTFLIGTGYCREAGEEHDTFESWADCSAAYACVAECQESAACVAVAWAATPQTPHDGCKDAGKPRCVRYWTRSGQLASHSDRGAREYRRPPPLRPRLAAHAIPRRAPRPRRG